MQPKPTLRTGVLLVQLGTPDAPRPREVRRYLREFLSDPRVLDMPALARKLLLEGIILPTRPRKSAAAYARIWTEAGSPLMVHSVALRDGVAKALGDDFVVELAMRYGRPGIAAALERLGDADVDRIVVLPLFPQYSAATTASILARVQEEQGRYWDVRPLTTIGDFYDEADFIEAWRQVAASALEGYDADHVLFSYHGLPESQVRESDPTGSFCLGQDDCCARIRATNRHCYRAQCHRTTVLVSEALGLDPERTTTSFQSRLGRTPWIRPYTDEVVVDLRQRGVEHLAVLSPAFVADNLETLEELGMQLAEQWTGLGGKSLKLVPSLNAHPAWVDAVAGLVRRSVRQG
jgi:ferrochelatase